MREQVPKEDGATAKIIKGIMKKEGNWTRFPYQ
jgi:hypothetical protein